MTTPSVGPCACRACLVRKGYIAGWTSFPPWLQNLVYVLTVIASAIVFALLMAGCTPIGPAFDACEPYHCEEGLEP